MRLGHAQPAAVRRGGNAPGRRRTAWRWYEYAERREMARRQDHKEATVCRKQFGPAGVW
ncbi:hypothetical protein CHLRE_09g417176v5 [Chlamydomonas reinhardtii]|uniref:Uncharacterized protein n=1 Tax=Chlamydomonas reinhardtii TaxID=3055 RepID=A0A2K3DG41_CHLRE|nr:uncharacterized protein CHLRE_09g417176v5 [Chlamydomonas reinhardtii]PNW79492.1 hypothetical protein CHLRE_09g417176v5 [Chlamydomonas reinhardtii]